MMLAPILRVKLDCNEFILNLFSRYLDLKCLNLNFCNDYRNTTRRVYYNLSFNSYCLILSEKKIKHAQIQSLSPFSMVGIKQERKNSCGNNIQRQKLQFGLVELMRSNKLYPDKTLILFRISLDLKNLFSKLE